jgi:hypothetical protein
MEDRNSQKSLRELAAYNKLNVIYYKKREVFDSKSTGNRPYAIPAAHLDIVVA